jgi:hypothetical protein
MPAYEMMNSRNAKTNNLAGDVIVNRLFAKIIFIVKLPPRRRVYIIIDNNEKIF